MISTPSKYGNRRTHVAALGRTFDSAAEARYATQLAAMERAGAISDLIYQPRYALAVNGLKVCEYRADFQYRQDGQTVVVDVKGQRTPVYRLKKRLMRAVLGIDVKEVAA